MHLTKIGNIIQIKKMNIVQNHAPKTYVHFMTLCLVFRYNIIKKQDCLSWVVMAYNVTDKKQQKLIVII